MTSWTPHIAGRVEGGKGSRDKDSDRSKDSNGFPSKDVNLSNLLCYF